MSHPLQETYWKLLTPPAALVDNASLTITELDTLGYEYLTVALLIGATDIAVTAMVLTESDTAGSNHANITGAIYATSTDIDGSTSAYPTATDDNKVFLWEIDLRGRKRYIDGTITIGDGTAGGYYTVLAIMGGAKNLKLTKTGRGLGGCLQV